MDREKTIDALNSLVIINNDRIEGYEKASNETDEQDLKTLFARFAQTSHNCKQELVIELTKLGGEPAEGTRVSGKLYRIWMDVKAAVTGRDRKAILESCEYGEDNAVETYDEALKDHQSDLSADQLRMISAQRALITADREKVTDLRNALVDA